MTSRELVLAALRGERTSRPPVVCPGGMMCFAVREVMQESGCWWPSAHHDPGQMARLAVAMQRATGFDSVGVPFCMTVEAEALGAEVDFGDALVPPRIVREPLQSIEEAESLAESADPARDRRSVVLEAIRRAKELAPEAAVMGAVLGPLSLAGQVLETSLLLRATRRRPQEAERLVRRCAEFITEFALAQVAAGADVVTIADPTATGEILGSRTYRRFAEPGLQQVIGAVRATGTPVILHICGCPGTILAPLADLDAEAISVDETANLYAARRALRRQRLMGNIGSKLLEAGPAASIAANVRGVLAAGVDILAPACGVTTATPVAHLRAMRAVTAGS